MSVWQEVISKGKMPKNDDIVDHHEPVSADPAGNVCSFGLLMLEIISGRPPYSEHKGSLANLVRMTINKSSVVTKVVATSTKWDLEANVASSFFPSGDRLWSALKMTGIYHVYLILP